MIVRALLLAALASVLLPSPAPSAPLDVSASRIETFGLFESAGEAAPLRFVGGLELAFPDGSVGGLSGIALAENGRRALMVSDQGLVIGARLVYENGRLSDFVEATLEPLFPGRGRDEERSDAEDVAFAGDDRAVVAFERGAAPVVRFAVEGGRLFDPVEVKTPEAVVRLSYNKGLESVAVAPPGGPQAGRILVVAERPPEEDGDRIPGWILGAGRFHIAARDGYDVTAIRFLPGGDLIVLERGVSWLAGFRMRLRRIAGGAIEPGALLDGEVLLEADMLDGADNMEGLAVHEDGEGRTILTLVSDDNRFFLQRTLLLQFVLET